MESRADIVICGAGIAGVATAHALATMHGKRDIVLLDPHAPLSLTTAASGENVRNWWPHPRMVDLANRSLDLIDQLVGSNDENFRFSRTGYAYATRGETAELIESLETTYGGLGAGDIRVHDEDVPLPAAKDGADVLTSQSAIRTRFPHLSEEITAVVLVRRAGDLDSQQMGQHMLGQAKAQGAYLVQGELKNVSATTDGFRLEMTTSEGTRTMTAGTLINAAGPFAAPVAAMLGVDLPLQCVYQQKIAFEDHKNTVPRDAPFTIDLDAGPLDWPQDVRALLMEYPETAWLTESQPGGSHVRPEGGRLGTWVKLGWATNETPEDPKWEPWGSDQFPEIVMRGAARMAPGLSVYCEDLPRSLTHYGSYYTRTQENWPLIGPMGDSGAFMITGLSGFGTMMACAAGELCAAWVTGTGLPSYARGFSLERYDDAALMSGLLAASEDGEL